MKDIIEYLQESVSHGRNRHKLIRADKESILDWLDFNGFDRLELKDKDAFDTNEIFRNRKDNIYVMSPTPGRGKSTDWVAIHGKHVWELCIWFDDSEKVEESVIRFGEDWGTGNEKYITFEEAFETMRGMLQ